MLCRSLVNVISHFKDPGVQERYATAKRGREVKAIGNPHVERAVFLLRKGCRYLKCGADKDKSPGWVNGISPRSRRTRSRTEKF